MLSDVKLDAVYEEKEEANDIVESLVPTVNLFILGEILKVLEQHVNHWRHERQDSVELVEHIVDFLLDKHAL